MNNKIELEAKRLALEWTKWRPYPHNDKVKKAEKKFKSIRDKWDKIRDQFCPANDGKSKCICSTHPEYKKLVLDSLEPASKEYEIEWKKEADYERLIYLEYYNKLTSAKLSKEKYFKMKQKDLSAWRNGRRLRQKSEPDGIAGRELKDVQLVT